MVHHGKCMHKIYLINSKQNEKLFGTVKKNSSQHLPMIRRWTDSLIIAAHMDF